MMAKGVRPSSGAREQFALVQLDLYSLIPSADQRLVACRR
jgi:hypothetical protein